MILELAQFEREPDAVQLTREQLAAALFDDHAAVFCLIAETDGHPGTAGMAKVTGMAKVSGMAKITGMAKVTGMALYFLNFSTWEGVHGIHLEDLYVRPQFRGAGYGGALLKQLARIATEHGYARVEWSVLHWNQTAIDFYDRIGGRPMSDWMTYRLSGDALGAYAGTRSGQPAC